MKIFKQICLLCVSWATFQTGTTALSIDPAYSPPKANELAVRESNKPGPSGRFHFGANGLALAVPKILEAAAKLQDHSVELLGKNMINTITTLQACDDQQLDGQRAFVWENVINLASQAGHRLKVEWSFSSNDFSSTYLLVQENDGFYRALKDAFVAAYAVAGRSNGLKELLVAFDRNSNIKGAFTILIRANPVEQSKETEKCKSKREMTGIEKRHRKCPVTGHTHCLEDCLFKFSDRAVRSCPA